MYLLHDIQQRLGPLSEKLKRFSSTSTSFSYHVDRKIKGENLKNNIATLLSKVIINLEYKDRGETAFVKIIDDYNEKNSTYLKLNDFLEIQVVRVIDDEIRLPEVIRQYVCNYSDVEADAEEGILSAGMRLCLKTFYEIYYKNSKCTIAGSVVNRLINEVVGSTISIDLLVEKGILSETHSANVYCWEDNSYVIQLRNEIAATLWLLLAGEEPTDANFRRFMKRLRLGRIWPDGLHEYLTNDDAKAICGYCVSHLNDAVDLVNSGSEFRKVWLDGQGYRRISIKDPVPFVNFTSHNSFALIEEMEFHELGFHDLFDFQETRRNYLQYIRFIIKLDQAFPSPYLSIISQLRDTSKPFIVWTIYRELFTKFPEIIPHLLSDASLSPIAFKALDNVHIDRELLGGQDSKEEQARDECDVIGSIWMEMFGITLRQMLVQGLDAKEVGQVLSRIFIYSSKKAFSQPRTSEGVIKQQYHLGRYNDILNAFFTITNRAIPPFSMAHIDDHFMPAVIEEMLTYMSMTTHRCVRTEFVDIDYSFVDLAIHILKASKFLPDPSYSGSIPCHALAFATRVIEEFYILDEVEVINYSEIGAEKRKVKRGVTDFGAEIVDWGYLYLWLQQFGLLDKHFRNIADTMQFDNASLEGKYAYLNKEQWEKLKIYLRLLLLAYISIDRDKDVYEAEGFPATETLSTLDNLIQGVALQYSVDDLPNNRIDIFDETLSHIWNRDTQHSLSLLLCKYINVGDSDSRKCFVSVFFEKNNDLGRLLGAINIIESRDLKELIAEKMLSINIDDYIASRITITDLETALIQSVNSESYWQPYAGKLIENIKKHYESKAARTDAVQALLFEVDLVLAFKKKDLDALNAIEVPKTLGLPGDKRKQEWRKQFFLALYNLYQKHDHPKAVRMLQYLISCDSKNVSYSFHLWRAKTIHALSMDDYVLLSNSNFEWERFRDGYGKIEGSDYMGLLQDIECNSVHYLAYVKRYRDIDRILNSLSGKYRYAEEVLHTIYFQYVSRGLHEVAFDYINCAVSYYKQQKLHVPLVLEDLRQQYYDEETIKRLKLLMGNLSSQKPDDIPKILPKSLNGKLNLSEFILVEILLAANVMLEKIESVRQITHENRYNDLLLAILRLRFPVWGWTIVDQSRIGTSAGGKDAGEADLLIQSSGQSIALWEALILRDSEYTKEHILRLEKYVKSLKRYYMIVYHTGKPSDFDNKWISYQADVMSTEYPVTFLIDLDKGFEDLSGRFEQVRHLKVAKTNHGAGIELFHVLINLGIKARKAPTKVGKAIKSTKAPAKTTITVSAKKAPKTKK